MKATETLLLEALEKIAADAEPYYSPATLERYAQANPYRCPFAKRSGEDKCGGNLDRYEPTKKHPLAPGFRDGYIGIGFSCPQHGDVKPYYDMARPQVGFSEPADCGCNYDSGPYRLPCDDHDPVAIAVAAIKKARGT